MPALFCRFSRDPAEGSISYPVACAPQAWAAGSVFLLLQACLGLGVSAQGGGAEGLLPDGRRPRVSFTRPRLLAFLSQLRITNLSVAGASVDLLLMRHGDDVGVNVLRREAGVEVVVAR